MSRTLPRRLAWIAAGLRLDHPDYYDRRGTLLGFRADCEPDRRSLDD